VFCYRRTRVTFEHARAFPGAAAGGIPDPSV
jgi:hypothetical protein